MIGASPADRLTVIRRRLREHLTVTRPRAEKTAIVDLLLDKWNEVAGVPQRPATGWASERPPAKP